LQALAFVGVLPTASAPLQRLLPLSHPQNTPTQKWRTIVFT